MSAHREDPQSSDASHASMWITLIVAVPLLYLLTLPAVVAMVVPIGSSGPGPSHWLNIYVAPAVWLSEMDVFSKLYNPYCEWCWKAVLKRTDTF